MNIIDRYILRAHVGPFIFGSSIVIFLFLMQFVIRAIDELVGKGLDVWVIIQLIILNLSWMAVLAIPIGVLFSTLMAFGNMAAAHEVTIIKASGGSLIRMMLPVILAGAILTTGLFWFNDRVLPEANHQAKILMSDIKRKKPTFSLESGRFSSDLDGYTILTRQVDSLTGDLFGVTIYDHRKVNMLNVVSADTGQVKFNNDFTKLVLTLYDGEIHQMEPGGVKSYRVIDFKKHIISIPASGFSFERTDEDVMSRGDREMRIADMRKITVDSDKKSDEATGRINLELQEHFGYLSGLPDTSKQKIINFGDIKMPKLTEKEILTRVNKRLGFLRSKIQSDLYQENEYTRRSRQYEVEIQKKYAIPFACLVFVFVGCPLGIITKGGNFGISAAITLGFYIIYWVCLIGGEKLADRGFLSPVFSMWLGNIVIAVMGIILTLRVSNETFSISLPGLIRKLFRR